MNHLPRAALAALTALALAHTPTPLASAEQPESYRPSHPLHLVLLGDSYSAGNGAGDYEQTQPGFYRSRNNWANRYRDWLVSRGIAARLNNQARSGAKIHEVIGEQLDHVTPGAALVMFSAGGNDGGFGDVATRCFVVGARKSAECRENVEAFRRFVHDTGPEGLRAKLEGLLNAIDARLGASRAEIVVMGYPHLVTPDAVTTSDSEGYVLRECVGLADRGQCLRWDHYEAGTEVRKVAEELTRKQRETVRAFNARSARTVHFVPLSEGLYDGHEPDPSAGNKNPQRWINEFWETEGDYNERGEITGHFTFDVANWYHPNKVGHRQTGDHLTNLVGVPRTVRGQETSPQDEPNPAEPSQVTAWLESPPTRQIGKPLTLDAFGSFSPSGPLVKFEWDLDGDGGYDTTTTVPILTHTWESEKVGVVNLRVTDSTGETDEVSTRVMVTNDGDSTPYAKDNCPEVDNHGQRDYDGDGIGDECDDTPGIPTEDLPGVGEGRMPDPTPSPEPSVSPTPTASPTPSPSPTPTPSASPSPSPSPTDSASPVPEPTDSASPVPTDSPSPSPAPTPTQPLPEPTGSTPVPSSPAPSISPDPSASGSVPLPTVGPVPTLDPTGAPSPTGPAPGRPNPVRPGLPKTGAGGIATGRTLLLR